jgi:hypothetical protein
MEVTGCLSELSFSELLTFLSHIHKTGCLSVRAASESRASNYAISYIWLRQGSVVAASDRIDNRGLLLLINQQGWFSERVISKLAQTCPENTSIGSYLRSQGVLHAEQLKYLFYMQMLRQFEGLCHCRQGEFRFETGESLPWMEMTGLSLPATDVTSTGLQILRELKASMGMFSRSSARPALKVRSQACSFVKL